MKTTIHFLVFLVSLLYFFSTYAQDNFPITIVIHGGAGTITRANMSLDMEEKYRAALSSALDAGYRVLEEGGKSADAVTAAITILENSPLFNAGKGAVFTSSGTNELDASFMDGKTLQAGAVAGVRKIKNPILAARAVMEKSEHVMLTGIGAEVFAKQQGLQMENPEYFATPRRKKQLEKAKKIDGDGKVVPRIFKYGTVGAVALDKDGNICAGTSTGGMTNKKYGRVGDTPIVGAGTYANNQTVGVSCTGHGEYFMRLLIAHSVSAKMQYLQTDLKTAANATIHKDLTELGGTGGLVSLDRKGNIAMPFNTEGMYRGYKNTKQKKILIYKDE